MSDQIDKSGRWANQNRSQHDSDYMTICEWCGWMIGLAGLFLDKGGDVELRFMVSVLGDVAKTFDSLRVKWNDRLSVDEDELKEKIEQVEKEGSPPTKPITDDPPTI